jgi:hypothetical protein
MKRIRLLAGAVLGASAAFLLDPDHGGERRRALAARTGKAARTAFDTALSQVERRAMARTGHHSRTVAFIRSPGQTLAQMLRRRRPPTGWDIPMATVNIDIDQGTVTLRGTFPPVDADVPIKGWRHRGPGRESMQLVGDEG